MPRRCCVEACAVIEEQMRQADKKMRVLALLTNGYITQAEAAALMGVTRQRIHQWIRAAGIHPIIARERLVRSLLRDARP